MALTVRTVWKRAGVAVVAAALVCGAAACSSDSTGGSGANGGKAPGASSPRLEPAAAVRKAADNSMEITTLSYRAKGTVPESGKVAIEASLSTEPLRVGMKLTGTDKGVETTTEMRVLSGGFYMNAGEELEPGKTWLKFPLDDKELATEGKFSRTNRNPAVESSFITGADDLELIGEEKVEGTATTHYRGTVTVADLRAEIAAEKDAEVREQRERSLEQYEELGIEKLTMDMWIDGNDHTKQFRVQGPAKKGEFDLTMTFFDINEPVEVKAPPAAETVDLEEMLADPGV